MRILVAYTADGRQQEIAVDVPHASTLQQALALLAGHIATSDSVEQARATGIWGKVRPPHYVLREGDRIEIYRPLKADPKQARRARVMRKAPRE